MKRRTLHRLAGLMIEESGAAAVEFAIVSVAFITFVTGIAYTAIMLHTNAALQWAVETTVRRAAIQPDVTQTDLQTDVNALLTATHMPNATVNYSVADVAGVSVATLTASFTRTYTIPFVATFNTTFSATTSTPQNDAS